MKFYTSFLFTTLLLSTSAHALNSKTEIVEQFDNLKMVTFIDNQDLANNPEWNADTEAPPLTVFNAIQSVKDSIKVSDAIQEIELRQIPGHAHQWHYLIKMKDDSMKSKYSVYAVLMNGKVIPAIIEPQGYK